MNRKLLEEERWRLANSFGRGPFADGLVRQRIEAIDRALTTQPTEKDRG